MESELKNKLKDYQVKPTSSSWLNISSQLGAVAVIGSFSKFLFTKLPLVATVGAVITSATLFLSPDKSSHLNADNLQNTQLVVNENTPQINIQSSSVVPLNSNLTQKTQKQKISVSDQNNGSVPTTKPINKADPVKSDRHENIASSPKQPVFSSLTHQKAGSIRNLFESPEFKISQRKIKESKNVIKPQRVSHSTLSYIELNTGIIAALPGTKTEFVKHLNNDLELSGRLNSFTSAGILLGKQFGNWKAEVGASYNYLSANLKLQQTSIIKNQVVTLSKDSVGFVFNSSDSSFTTLFEEKSDTSFEIIKDITTSDKYISQKVLQIPLFVGYSKRAGRWDFGLKAGVTADILMLNQVVTTSDHLNLATPAQYSVNWNVAGGPEISFAANNHLEFNVSGIVMSPVNHSNMSYLLLDNVKTSYKFGVRYRF